MLVFNCNMEYVLIAVIIIILIILFSKNLNTNSENITSSRFKFPVVWQDLSESEKIQYVSDKYLNPVKKQESQKTKMENKYIDLLPRNSNCSDKYTKCKDWANTGDCVINPEFMLYNCKSSCNACKLSDQERYNVSAILNSRDPIACSYHGTSYPDPYKFSFDVIN